MKIVFNTDQIFLHGGIEKVMATKANFLANQHDIEVYIVTTQRLVLLKNMKMHFQLQS